MNTKKQTSLRVLQRLTRSENEHVAQIATQKMIYLYTASKSVRDVLIRTGAVDVVVSELSEMANNLIK